MHRVFGFGSGDPDVVHDDVQVIDLALQGGDHGGKAVVRAHVEPDPEDICARLPQLHDRRVSPVVVPRADGDAVVEPGPTCRDLDPDDPFAPVTSGVFDSFMLSTLARDG